MSHLRVFTVEADAEGRLARKRNSEQSSSRREDSALQRDLCRRLSGDVSPRCKSLRALSPRTKTFSTTTTSSAAVSTSIPQLCLCGRRPPLLPIDLLLPKFADKDYIQARLESMWVATQEYPASPIHLASQSPCLDLDAISSEDSDVKPGDALSASPITVISVDSSNGDPDSSEDHSSTGSSSLPGSHTSSSTSDCVVVSPSHYPTPEEPDVLSAESSVLISPNRVREDCTSVTAEVYPVFEVSPDTTGSVLTSMPVPPSSPMVSLPPPPPTFSPVGAPLSLSLFIVRQNISTPTMVWLLYFRCSLCRMAWCLCRCWLLMIRRPCRNAHRGGKAPLCCFLFKGFVQGCPLCCVRCAVGYRVRPLVTDMTQGCPYCMTSYEPMNIADVDLVYGLQLTHPRFLEFLGAPKSAQLLSGSRVIGSG